MGSLFKKTNLYNNIKIIVILISVAAVSFYKLCAANKNAAKKALQTPFKKNLNTKACAQISAKQKHEKKTNQKQATQKNLKQKVVSKQAANLNEENRLAKKAFEHTNTYRVQNGLKKLKWHDGLAKVAKSYSKKLALKQAPWGHGNISARVNHLNPKVAAENLYYSNASGNRARLAVDAWIKSPGHNKNLLLSCVDNVGIGVYKNAQGTYYFTQNFAKF